MKRVLLTGMSGTGKSAVVRALTTRGYKAIDTDDGWCDLLPDGRQLWREGAIETLLATEDTDILFVAGCEENQVRFHPRFDHVILLSAPVETLTERLATRTSNPFGKTPAELRRILADVEQIEPLLRQRADHEIRTTAPLAEVVTTILGIVGTRLAARPVSYVTGVSGYDGDAEGDTEVVPVGDGDPETVGVLVGDGDPLADAVADGDAVGCGGGL